MWLLTPHSSPRFHSGRDRNDVSGDFTKNGIWLQLNWNAGRRKRDFQTQTMELILHISLLSIWILLSVCTFSIASFHPVYLSISRSFLFTTLFDLIRLDSSHNAYRTVPFNSQLRQTKILKYQIPIRRIYVYLSIPN